ncbi:GRAM domain-containing protein 4 [Balamuthia mandrillaris]
MDEEAVPTESRQQQGRRWLPTSLYGNYRPLGDPLLRPCGEGFCEQCFAAKQQVNELQNVISRLMAEKKVLLEQSAEAKSRIEELIMDNQAITVERNELQIQSAQTMLQLKKLSDFLEGDERPQTSTGGSGAGGGVSRAGSLFSVARAATSTKLSKNQSTSKSSTAPSVVQVHRSQKNKRFQEHFGLPPSECKIAKFVCLNEYLQTGKLYLTANYLCFDALLPLMQNIEHKLVIPLLQITHISKNPWIGITAGYGITLQTRDDQIFEFWGFTIQRKELIARLMAQAAALSHTIVLETNAENKHHQEHA